MHETHKDLIRRLAVLTISCFLLSVGCGAKLHEKPKTAAGQCSIDLPYKIRESCLETIPPRPNQWKRVPKMPPPSGYVCAFYSIHGPMTCNGEVRTVSRWKMVGPKQPDTAAILYFAPSRIPHRPSPDASGMRVIESDGSVFAFFEIDDYVAVMETSSGHKTEGIAALMEWAEQLTSALQSQIVAVAPIPDALNMSAEDACLSDVNHRPSTLNETAGAFLNVSPGDIAEAPVYWGEGWEQEGEPFFFTVNGTDMSLIRLVYPGDAYGLVLSKAMPKTQSCIVGIWAYSFGGNGIEFIDISRTDDTNGDTACIRVQLQGWLRAYMADANDPDSLVPAKSELMEVILETDANSVRCVSGPGC